MANGRCRWYGDCRCSENGAQVLATRPRVVNQPRATPIRRVAAACRLLAICYVAVLLVACRRQSGIPPLPMPTPSIQDSASIALARALAPTLYVQRDEPFPLERVVAIVHPSLPVIAYVIVWQWDVNGQWLPWAKTSDEEEIWVGYDRATHAATDLWTYWHGAILHTDWRGHGPVGVDVQWGKHGSLPRGVIESDLPRAKTLNLLYLMEFALLPDIWMGRLRHGGPWGFFHDYARYREFTRAVPLAERLDAVLSAEQARCQLRAILGRRYSHKRQWPMGTAPTAAASSADSRSATRAGDCS